MATWRPFDYGPLAHQIAEYWSPATGSNRPCLVYCPGGGWSTTSQRGFYDSNVGHPLFTGPITDNEAVSGLEVVCISMMYGMAYHDFNNDLYGNDLSWDSWDSGTDYDRGDIVAYNPVGISAWGLNTYSSGDLVKNDSSSGPSGEIFECIAGHNATNAREPGEGVDWETYWVSLETTDERRSYECVQSYTSPIASAEPVTGANWQTYWRPLQPNNIANASETIAGGDLRKTASVSSYMSEGIRDVQIMVQFLKANADFFRIDPNKITLIGDSAGASTAGTAAYSQPAPYSAGIRRNYATSREVSSGSNWKVPVYDSSVLGVILEICPCDYSWYGEGASLHGRNLFGVNFATNDSATEIEYDLIPDEIKSSISPLGALKATGNAIPTFLRYNLSQLGDGNDPGTNPPWTNEAPYHHARNGYYIQQELLALGMSASDCPFYDTSNGANTLPDIANTMWSWFRNLTGI